MKKKTVKNLSRIVMLILFMTCVGMPTVFSRNANNNDCINSQYGEGKATVETNCVVSSTGWSWSQLWWSTFDDGVAKCCASVMDCSKTCDRDDETVCHGVGNAVN
ncbi:MAG: hypothetical protein ACI9Z3_001400 [Roseivirga sp.]|jgi:hypothetical protein